MVDAVVLKDRRECGLRLDDRDVLPMDSIMREADVEADIARGAGL